MPALITSTTEGKIAVLTNCKLSLRVGRNAFRLLWHFGLSLGLVALTVGVFCFMKLEAFRLFMFFGSSRTLTPRPRTVYGVFVTLELRLVLQTDVSLHDFRFQWDLQQFTGANERSGFSSLASRLESSFALLCTTRLKTSNSGEISFFDGVVVEVL